MSTRLEREQGVKITRLEKELKREQRKHEREQREHDKTRKELTTLQSLWKSAENQKVDPDRAHIMHSRELLDEILSDDHMLHFVTGHGKEKFDHMLEKFEKELSDYPDVQLFSEDGKPDPRNRCKLSHRHALLLGAMRSRTNTKQELLAILFGIDQSTVWCPEISSA